MRPLGGPAIATPPDAGFLGCVALGVGACAGGVVGVALGYALLAPIGSAVLVGGVVGGFLGAIAGLALSPRLAVVAPVVTLEQLLGACAIGGLAAAGTALSPIPAWPAGAPVGAFLIAAALTTAACVRANAASHPADGSPS